MAHPKRILLVEASRDRKIQMIWAMESAGHVVRLEADAERALFAAKSFRPDVAVIGTLGSVGTAPSLVPLLERDHGVPVIVLGDRTSAAVSDSSLLDRLELALRDNV